MTAVIAIMAIPKTIISTPITAALTILVFSWFARVVFAQATVQTTNEDLFYWIGRIVVISSLATLAVAAIYSAFRKAAYTEQKELATTRKEKNLQLEKELSDARAYIRDLEAINESLEKKNFRLQDERAGK